MSSDSERAASAETYQEKALRKFKQQPLVPIGAAATTFALIMAGSKLRKRQSKSMNYWLRARVITQGLTIVAVVAGSWMMGQTKSQLDQAAVVAVAEGVDLTGREKRKIEFEERLRGAEESHRLEVAAAAGKGPVGQGQTVVEQVKTFNPEEANEKGKSGFGWSMLSKAAWFGGSTTKTPPSSPSSSSTPAQPPTAASDDKRP